MLDFDRLTQVLTPLGSVMVDVAVIGAGQTKYGNHQLGLKGMWAEAAENAFSSVDKDFDPRQVDEAFIGSVAFGGAQLGNTAALLTEHSGLDGIPVRRVEMPALLLVLHYAMLGWPSKAVKQISLWLVELKK